ncbi:hypothetical protein CU098_002484, partial [Rhizopus stolonifer]
MSTRTIVTQHPNPVNQESRRKHELAQLKTRYKTTYKTIKQNNDCTVIRLAVKPTDPDFPFELTWLQMQLSISKDYPFSPCQLVVLNPDIPRGLAINLEKGHSTLVKNSKTHLTLVRQMNWIDRNMEVLLRQTPSCKVFSENLLVNDAQLTNIQLLSPSLENVSLFRCGTLHLVVKCMDCKDILDVELESEQDNQVMKKKPCLTCSNNMSVSFFP